MVQWKVKLPGVDASDGLAWAAQFLEDYDTRPIEWIRIDRGRGSYQGVYGRIYYPVESRPTFRISCQVPGPFPCSIVTRKKPIYRHDDGSWPRVPHGCRRGTQCYDPRTGRQWYRVLGATAVRDINEAIVWIIAHEAFHYLRKTRQIPGRNTEIEADRYADRQLAAFQILHTPDLVLAALFDE